MEHHPTIIYLKKSHDDAVIPTQKEGDVGWDLYAVEDVRLNPFVVTKVNTGIQLANTPLVHGKGDALSVLMKIEGRSGMASRGTWPVGGIIDPSYRGDIIVGLYNGSEAVKYVKAGERIAQLVLYPVLATKSDHHVSFKEVDWQFESERGDGGFGSSGR